MRVAVAVPLQLQSSAVVRATAVWVGYESLYAVVQLSVIQVVQVFLMGLLLAVPVAALVERKRYHVQKLRRYVFRLIVELAPDFERTVRRPAKKSLRCLVVVFVVWVVVALLVPQL